MDLADITGLCLVAEGFPREVEPQWISCAIANATGIQVHQLALLNPDVSLGKTAHQAKWLLRFCSHDDQKKCLLHFKRFLIPLKSGGLQITLDFPDISDAAPPLSSWFTAEEKQMDSVRTADLFDSGHSSSKECPGAGSPQGLLGPGESPPGEASQGAPYMSYPGHGHHYPGPGYQPNMQGQFGHPGGSDPSMQGGSERMMYPQSQEYQHNYPGGDGGQYGYNYAFSPPPQQYGPGIGGYPNMGPAFGEMEQPSGRYANLGTLDSSLMEEDMQSDFVVLEQEGAKHQFHLRVTELPPNVTEQELGEFFQDRRKSGGGPIEQIAFDHSGAAAIYFADREVIDRVMRRAPHLLRGKKIKVELASENQQTAKVLEIRTVEVRGVEDEQMVEMCEYYFENPAKGGGDIEDRRWDEQEKVLYITFVDAAVAKETTSRGHKVGGKVLEVTLYEPPSEEDTGPQCTVEVRGFNPAMEEDLYEMYFENPKKGGGPIKEMTKSEDGTVLLITFESPEVAEHIATLTHQVGGSVLQVTLAPKEKPSSGPPCTVKVTGIAPDLEDMYRMYFEHPKKGGGSIADFKLDAEQKALFVTFEDPEVAEAVCGRSHKVGGRELQVTLHIPQKGPTRQRSCEPPAEEEEEAPLRTVEVKSVGELQTDDSYLYYFENPRNGGGEVEDVKIDQEKRVVYVTFTEPKVAEAVANRKHKLGGQPIQVQLYVPPKPKPAYPQKLLFQNVAESTTKDCLVMYLERITGLEPEDILYGDEPGMVLVTFPEQPDFAKVQDQCRERKLEKRQLSVSKVPISTCLLVEGLASTTTEDTVTMYFENSRRSGGGPVEKVEITQDKDMCRGFVYFEDHQVLGQVLEKAHKIDGKTLQVKCYMECLGLSGGSQDPTNFSPPKPIILKDTDKFKIAFIRQSSSAKEDLSKQLAEVNAMAKFQDNTLTIECSLTKDIPKVRILARTWTKDVQHVATEFFTQVDVHRRDVMQQLWQEVDKSVLSSPIPNREEAVMFPLPEEKALVVVGWRDAAKNLFSNISKQVVAIEEEAERKRQEITETNGKLKIHQLRLLIAMAFHAEASKRHPGLHVDINTKKCEITFHGMMHEVKEAQVEMYDLLNNVKTEKITDLSDLQKALLDKKETRQVIVQKFKPDQVVAVWEVGKKEVTIFAFNDDSTVKAVHIIHKSVVHHICELTPESTELLRRADWQSLIKTLQERNPGKLLIVPSHDGHQVHVTGTDDIMHGVVEDVENFMQEHTVYSEVVRYSPCRQRFITYYWQHKLQQIGTALKAYQVKIVLRENEAEMSIRGTSVGLEQLKTRLQQLEGDMVVHTESFSDQAKVKFLNSSTAGKDLEMLGRSCQCVVSLDLEPPGLQIVGPSRGAGLSLSDGDVKTSTKVQLPCGVTISVVQGDITQIPADVIVNAANSRMDHIGGLARVIVEKGGKSIQDECYSIMKARGGQLNDGDVLVSNGGRLPCKAIIHAVGPMYKGGKSGEEDCLHDTVVKCLETASSASHSSIAIPAICTGIFHYPPAEATLVILDAIKTYLDSHRRVSIKIVYLCHLEADMVQHFCKALRKVFPSAHTQTTPTPKARTGMQKTVKTAPWAASGAGATGGNYQVIHVSVLEGEIAKQRADVIVNSTSNGLDLKNGAVSSSILKVAGSSLQDECKTRYPSGIKTGDIAFTNGCGLDCKEVFHLALCNWSNPNAEQLLGLVVTKCLIEASKRHYDTIAFPVLGTGNLGYPRDVVANTMLGAIDKFQQDTPSTSLQEARIVVYHTDKQILQDFHQVQSRIGGPVSTPQARRSATRQGRKFSDGGAGLATPSTQAAGAKGVASAEFSIDGLTLVIKQGDITEENVDAIVNSSNSQLDLSRGAVASALRHRGGKQLEAECKLRLADISDTGIAVTKGYKIKSKLILHIDAERFADDKGGYARQTGETWETGIKLCLKAAEDNGIRTLALPALGTGGYGMTPSASARVLFDTVTRFCKKRRNLTEIRVVLYDKKMIPQYIGAIQSAAESHNKDNKGIVNWVKGLAGYSAPDVKLTQSSPELEDAKLHIYAGSQNSVKEVLKALEDMVRDRFTRKTLLDDTLMNMSSPEIEEIYQIGRKHNVEVRVQSMTGQVLIDGLHNDVFEAMQKISQFIRTAERRRQEELTAEMLLNMVQWCYLEVTATGNQMADYAKTQNHIIEMAYQGKKSQAEIVDADGNVYVIDFSTMKEYPKTDPRDTVSVIRRDKIKDMGSGSLPECWASHSPNEQIKLVSLLAADPEYQGVEKNLRATLGSNRNITVSAISRIQNPTLYRQYAAKKAHLEKQNVGHNNELTLWHGTAADAMDNINMYGFNRSYCGKNAVYYGQGVYFAINSNYSTHATYSPPDSAGKRYVYQCKVLAGHATQGNQNLRTLPARQGQILFDSATDNLQKPQMYVIFNDTQAYPEYLITFTGT